MAESPRRIVFLLLFLTYGFCFIGARGQETPELVYSTSSPSNENVATVSRETTPATPNTIPSSGDGIPSFVPVAFMQQASLTFSTLVTLTPTSEVFSATSSSETWLHEDVTTSSSVTSSLKTEENVPLFAVMSNTVTGSTSTSPLIENSFSSSVTSESGDGMFRSSTSHPESGTDYTSDSYRTNSLTSTTTRNNIFAADVQTVTDTTSVSVQSTQQTESPTSSTSVSPVLVTDNSNLARISPTISLESSEAATISSSVGVPESSTITSAASRAEVNYQGITISPTSEALKESVTPSFSSPVTMLSSATKDTFTADSKSAVTESSAVIRLQSDTVFFNTVTVSTAAPKIVSADTASSSTSAPVDSPTSSVIQTSPTDFSWTTSGTSSSTLEITPTFIAVTQPITPQQTVQESEQSSVKSSSVTINGSYTEVVTKESKQTDFTNSMKTSEIPVSTSSLILDSASSATSSTVAAVSSSADYSQTSSTFDVTSMYPSSTENMAVVLTSRESLFETTTSSVTVPDNITPFQSDDITTVSGGWDYNGTTSTSIETAVENTTHFMTTMNISGVSTMDNGAENVSTTSSYHESTYWTTETPVTITTYSQWFNFTSEKTTFNQSETTVGFNTTVELTTLSTMSNITTAIDVTTQMTVNMTEFESSVAVTTQSTETTVSDTDDYLISFSIEGEELNWTETFRDPKSPDYGRLKDFIIELMKRWFGNEAADYTDFKFSAGSIKVTFTASFRPNNSFNAETLQSELKEFVSNKSFTLEKSLVQIPQGSVHVRALNAFTPVVTGITTEAVSTSVDLTTGMQITTISDNFTTTEVQVTTLVPPGFSETTLSQPVTNVTETVTTANVTHSEIATLSPFPGGNVTESGSNETVTQTPMESVTGSDTTINVTQISTSDNVTMFVTSTQQTELSNVTFTTENETLSFTQNGSFPFTTPYISTSTTYMERNITEHVTTEAASVTNVTENVTESSTIAIVTPPLIPDNITQVSTPENVTYPMTTQNVTNIYTTENVTTLYITENVTQPYTAQTTENTSYYYVTENITENVTMLQVKSTSEMITTENVTQVMSTENSTGSFTTENATQPFTTENVTLVPILPTESTTGIEHITIFTTENVTQPYTTENATEIYSTENMTLVPITTAYGTSTENVTETVTIFTTENVTRPYTTEVVANITSTESVTTEFYTSESSTTPTTATSEITTAPETMEKNMTFEGSFRIIGNLNWSEEFSNMSSPYTLAVMKDLQMKISDLFKSSVLSPYFESAQVNNLREGVMVYYDVKFINNPVVTPANLTSAFLAGLDNESRLGGVYMIEPRSAQFQVEPGPSEGYTFPPWAIAVIVCGSIVLIFIVIMIVLLSARFQSRQKYKMNNEDPEDIGYRRSLAPPSSSVYFSDPSSSAYDNNAYDNHGVVRSTNGNLPLTTLSDREDVMRRLDSQKTTTL